MDFLKNILKFVVHFAIIFLNKGKAELNFSKISCQMMIFFKGIHVRNDRFYELAIANQCRLCRKNLF
jgi:hypothetical protein